MASYESLARRPDDRARSDGRRTGETEDPAVGRQARDRVQLRNLPGSNGVYAHLRFREVQRKTAVVYPFLFSDICGSTNLVEAIGDAAWRDLVDWHDRTLRGLYREHRGEEVDHAGVGFFVAFTTAGSALGCAVAIQQALAEHRRHQGYAPPVRIGVHSATAIQVGGGYRGKGIHAAARIGAVAAADEVVASRDAADAAGLRFSNPRTLELKGLLDPVELVTIDWEYR